ncbi:MAG: hypothetical protein ACKVWV_10605 [Planctomycetota bacterium]
MNADCRSFQRLLESALSGRTPRPLSELAWHEHLLGCADCRRVLEGEEALDMLLATLPEPKLPRELAARVVKRLRHALAQEGLDVLLELDAVDPVPAGLASDVLSKLAAARGFTETPDASATLSLVAAAGSTPRTAEARDTRLEELLDRARDVAVPDALAERVLAGLRFSRRRRVHVPRFLYAAAAVLVIALGVAWQWRARRMASEAPPPVADARGDVRGENAPFTSVDSQPEPELLAALDVLEQWDLLLHDDVDVLLSTLEPSEIDALEAAADEPLSPAPPAQSEPPPKTKG